MNNILLLDTSVSSDNKGDDIIMECVKHELEFLTKGNFVLNAPTHLSPFNPYEIWKNSYQVRIHKNCIYKFVCGTNLLAPNMLSRFPQWNLNIFNYQAAQGCILVGVGAKSGDKINLYTRLLYRKLLNKNYYHSVRDKRSKALVEEIGLKAINTGCVSMWMITPEFCKTIPTNKASKVVFTLAGISEKDERDQRLIDILKTNYATIYFWIQGISDYEYLNNFNNIEDIIIIPPDINTYKDILMGDDIDYVGIRLHGGIYAIRHKKRSIIIAIDERAREISRCTGLNCIEKDQFDILSDMINSEIRTDIKMPLDEINRWKAQFR
ncbi:MAG: polysaccharide pyruvyl transferase family protein [Armatimonadota bacterium]